MGTTTFKRVLGEDEQGEFVVKRFETAWQHARARGPRREPEETNQLERVTIADTELGVLQAPGEEAVGAAGELVLEEEDEEVGGGELVGLRLDQAGLEARGHAAEGKVAQGAQEFGGVHRHRLLPFGRDPGGGHGSG